MFNHSDKIVIQSSSGICFDFLFIVFSVGLVGYAGFLLLSPCLVAIVFSRFDRSKPFSKSRSRKLCECYRAIVEANTM